jgi:hypothetical protein
MLADPRGMDGREQLLDVTVRGELLSDETFYFVRRCNLRMLERAGAPARHVDVLIERPRASAEVHACVALVEGSSSLCERGRDLDVLFAVREAFDRLTIRLLEARGLQSVRSPTRSPLAVVDESFALMRIAMRRQRRG